MLDAPREGMPTIRQQAVQARLTMPNSPSILDSQPTIDWRIEPAYKAYQSIQRYRHCTFDMMGGVLWQPLSSDEILNWMKLERNWLPYLFIRTIKEMDQVFLNFVREQRENKENTTKLNNTSEEGSKNGK